VRKRIVAGNWKMHMGFREGAALAKEILEGIGERGDPDCEVVLMPPFVTLPAVMEVIGGSAVAGGAQDLFYEEAGAFTGEISGGMLAELGVRYVLAGHSERRHIIGEGNDLVARKLAAALSSGLTPVLCVGELLEERESGRAEEVVLGQVSSALKSLTAGECSKVVVAYEPVWAIGTGRTATPEDASGMHRVIRDALENLHGKEISDKTSILYGGSVKPQNAAVLFAAPDIDGVLVGGASLAAESFLGILFP
jgi:triosephosphate isomerase